MNISEQLRGQVERFNRTRSFALDNPAKKELAAWNKAAGFGTLNIGCSTCIRNAMQKLSNEVTLTPKISFIGVKQKSITEMTFNELKAEAKKRGLNLPSTSKKVDIIKALS